MKDNICLKIDLNDFKKSTLNSGKSGKFSKNNVTVLVLGNVYGQDCSRMTPENICDIYLKHSEKTNNYLDGVYSVIIFDYDSEKVYVFQDYFGSEQAIYYYPYSNTILISNSLKTIISNDNIAKKINNKTVKQFLLKGYCADKSTLIKGIYKVPSKKYLKIDVKKKKIKLKKIKREKVEKKSISIEDYDKVVEKVCLSCAHEDIATTVSQGYDSNYILHNLHKIPVQNNINAFCIGGTIGRNEIPYAEKICEYYGDVELHSKLVDGTSLNKLPELIYILEGSVYELGIFLQYELAKLVKSYDCKNIMLGECADQVLNFEIHHPKWEFIRRFNYTKKKLPPLILKKIHFRPFRSAYAMASHIVVKKNGIMMNYFDINTEYPYLRKDFIKTAGQAVKIGEEKKEFHKKAFNSVLPSEICKLVQKQPGAIEAKNLFWGTDISLEAVKEICKKSEFYKKKKFDNQFYEIDYYLKITYLEIFKKMFIEEREKYLTDTFGDFDLLHFFPELTELSLSLERNIIP